MHHSPKTFSAVIVGAGFSGLCMGIKLKEKGIHDFIILEKASTLGGTWRENTYPGAECDVPSALYSYSFEPYPFWEYKWSHQPQILAYLKHCAKKYDLYQHIYFEKELASTKWNETESFWEVKTKDKTRYKSKTFIPAIGQLHHISIPAFKGLELLKTPHFHSAKWNHNISFKDKKVAVVGNAASAIQFIPQIAKSTQQLTVFQRSANWMLPKQDRLYKAWEKRLVTRFPFLLKLYRLKLWLLGGALFFMMKKGNNWIRNIYQWKTKRYIQQSIEDPAIRKKLLPKYPLGAKRVLFSDDYYTTLNQDNVSIITDSIATFHQNGITTKDGTKHDFDLVVFGTGFKTTPFLMGLDIQGKNELTIQEAWKDGSKNYLGITVNDFPNFFMMYGPNTNLGHNSIIIMSEAQANYIAQCVSALHKNNWKSLDVKKDVLQTYYTDIQKRLKQMIWSQIENSWYHNAKGEIPTNWPGRTMEYIRRTKKVDFSVFDITK